MTHPASLESSNWNETRQLSAREAVLKDQLISDVNLILVETRAKITHLEQSETDLEWLMDAFSQAHDPHERARNNVPGLTASGIH